MSMTALLIIKELFKFVFMADPGKKVLEYYSVPDGRYHKHETDEWIIEFRIKYTKKV